MKWCRGTEIRSVSSHVRLEVVAAVFGEGKKVIVGVETGGPYASEAQMLRKVLERLRSSKRLPFIADRGYDAIDIKETFRVGIKHPLRKLSKENWSRYGRNRYMIEQLFGSIKQKIGSSFRLIREDLARKELALFCGTSM